MSWQDIAAIVVGAVVVAIVIGARIIDRRRDRHHHHRVRFGIFIERNGDRPDREEDE